MCNGFGVFPFLGHSQWLLSTKVSSSSYTCIFVGCINVKNNISQCAEILEFITKLTKKGKRIVWGLSQQEAIKNIKAIILESIILPYLDINQPFILYMDSSNTHLEGLLVHVEPNTNERKHQNLFLKTLSAELNYPVTYKELLGIAKPLKCFHNIIYCAEIFVGWVIETSVVKMHSAQVNVSILVCQVFTSKLEMLLRPMMNVRNTKSLGKEIMGKSQSSLQCVNPNLVQ